MFGTNIPQIGYCGSSPNARNFASSTGEKAADISPKPTIPCRQASIINKSSNNQNQYSYGKDL